MHLWLAFFRGLFGLFPPRQPGEAREDGDERRAVRRDLCKAINSELARKDRK